MSREWFKLTRYKGWWKPKTIEGYLIFAGFFLLSMMGTHIAFDVLEENPNKMIYFFSYFAVLLFFLGLICFIKGPRPLWWPGDKK